MTVAEIEMSLEQFFRSKWFVRLARVSAICGGLVVSVGGVIIGWAVFDTRANAETASVAAATVAAALSTQSQLVDAALSSVASDIEDITRTQEVIRGSQVAQSNGLARIEGVLEQLQRDAIPARFATPSNLR